MKRLCVIPARGGSKRIPRKNLKDFRGRPIIAWSIEAALDSALFHTVMVSTDDSEIADVARSYGAAVPFMRSATTANDHATTADVLLEVLNEFDRSGLTFDTVCCLYATAPFVTVERLHKAVGHVEQEGWDCAFPIVPFSHPVQRALVKGLDGVEYAYPEYAAMRSQDLDPRFQDAGQFYVFQPATLQSTGRMMGNRAYGMVIPETEAQDLDTETDWVIAELKFDLFRRG